MKIDSNEKTGNLFRKKTLVLILVGAVLLIMLTCIFGIRVPLTIIGLVLFVVSFCFGRAWQKESEWFIGISLAFLSFIFLFAANQIILLFLACFGFCLRGISIFRLHAPERRKFKNFARGTCFIIGGLLTILNVSSLI